MPTLLHSLPWEQFFNGRTGNDVSNPGVHSRNTYAQKFRIFDAPSALYEPYSLTTSECPLNPKHITGNLLAI